MIIYLALSAILIKQVYSFLYPTDYEIILNIIENRVNNLKEDLEPQMMSLGYNLLYYYSLAQIYFNKFISFVSPHISVLWIAIINFLRENKLIDKPKNVTLVEIYKGGQMVNNITVNGDNTYTLLNIIGEPINKDDYDFIIITEKNIDYKQNDKIHYTELPQLLEDYKYSNIRFFALDLTYKNETYSIELLNERDNHYIVNNVLNKEFFNYYLTNVLNKEIDKNNFDYKVALVDHNVNMVELTANDYLVIKEDDYEVKKINTILELNTITQTNDNIIEETEKNEPEIDGEADEADKSDESDDYVNLYKDR
jgi:hypothetical protein